MPVPYLRWSNDTFVSVNSCFNFSYYTCWCYPILSLDYSKIYNRRMLAIAIRFLSMKCAISGWPFHLNCFGVKLDLLEKIIVISFLLRTQNEIEWLDAWAFDWMHLRYFEKFFEILWGIFWKILRRRPLESIKIWHRFRIMWGVNLSPDFFLYVYCRLYKLVSWLMSDLNAPIPIAEVLNHCIQCSPVRTEHFQDFLLFMNKRPTLFCRSRDS